MLMRCVCAEGGAEGTGEDVECHGEGCGEGTGEGVNGCAVGCGEDHVEGCTVELTWRTEYWPDR